MIYRDKVILITGTSRGIGLKLAEYFLKKDAKVFGISRKKSPLNHENYKHFMGDIADIESVQSIFNELKTHTSKLDILINNAGISSMNSLLLMPKNTIKKIIDVNLVGGIYLAQESIKIMSKNKYGRIINFTSIAVPLHIEGEAIYSCSKAAIEELTKTLSKEIFHLGITINNIGPSLIDTKLISSVPEEKLKKIFDSLVLKKFLNYEDIYNVVEFYCREESKNVTGQTIYLGGAF